MPVMTMPVENATTESKPSTGFAAKSLKAALCATAARNWNLAVVERRKQTLPTKGDNKPTPVTKLTTMEYLLSQAGRYFWNNLKNVAVDSYDSILNWKMRTTEATAI